MALDRLVCFCQTILGKVVNHYKGQIQCGVDNIKFFKQNI